MGKHLAKGSGNRRVGTGKNQLVDLRITESEDPTFVDEADAMDMSMKYGWQSLSHSHLHTHGIVR